MIEMTTVDKEGRAKIEPVILVPKDYVQIVRCKDCKYFVKGRDWFSCQKWYMDIRKDDYCSFGERNEDGH